ncbi:MAG: GNAT family N-acetyltransferase [Brasilonema octagenarum HA4186-MV1]|jgi:GNAT superfamily N-acetyltransferase|uniref:GNAT family N-acetyltransferase n=1 Tax=Brasilonema octagenarum UFV-OR1 TaxID=417115 RepID=A0ABX1M901_9CYAN|nr:GNAT family N-acetyltransferase [Brasilonema octagenarum]MBW4624284.1 GNAT family N-acetyltransferase [Brasilonema octagenarum HA4186-MV1]NMF62472.1 GNAT family N-acetyltransferase [Brasilonema octagenarum UFV-OR1]
MKSIEVTRTHLQMRSPDEHNPVKIVGDDSEALLLSADRAHVTQVFDCPASFYRYLYCEVGHEYHWVYRRNWTDEQIQTHLSQPSISLWVLYYTGAPSGYFELEQYEDGSVEIAYFGLLKEYTGRGLGKYLLTIAIEQAWKKATHRIWVHTCTLDHPAALSNYLKRGFKPFEQETYIETIYT